MSAVVCAGAAVHQIEQALPLAALLALAQSKLHLSRGLYQVRLSSSALAEVPALVSCTLFVWGMAAALLAAWDLGYALSLAHLTVAVGVQLLVLVSVRGACHQVRRVRRRRRPHPTLVIGRSTDAYQLVQVLQQQPQLGLRPVGLSTTSRIPPPATGGKEPALPVLGDRDAVARALIQNGVEHVVLASSGGSPPWVAPDLMRLFDRYGQKVWVIDSGEEDHHLVATRSVPDHLYGYPAQMLRFGASRRPSMRAKRAVDALLSGVALVVLSPVVLACALAVRCSDGPGVLFRQVRIGQDGRPFTLVKFRTLRPADATESETRWNIAGDARLSRVGGFLRRSSLDELPQLWNVLRGDMSLVGPRPERPYFVAKFTKEHPGYAARHRMPVGITGLAQVNGLRGDTSIADRVRFDNRYITTWTLWQDMCVVLRTVVSLLRVRGG
ncbi:exopolysaccharide biosynthesis polyprenyl glycosylphosphotransferase [Streptomyces sp. B-S-A8]|uniref:Exopolysaccharide biosynthesis polyprenyl glycosylphosphotransferase n=1 Tax=Streptomyces solicavernae TaxID=3043614 RepID=A0ABT6RVL7_9ACTN|nr:exopolysaccharide biosynthesis polyprenyl glycosylphosphotransferase [Streptomyces sp. B-S-A8]MDI3388469.1 exopolysaccharide biosynthesis polyprenyl glycosylphosphotransferase [Streptomyces sp. B-S-A8]